MNKATNLFYQHTTPKTHRIITKDRGDYNLKVYIDDQDRKIGIRSSLNYWKIFQYDRTGNKVYEMDSDGNWEKRKYCANNKIIQYSNSSGTHWVKNN